VIKEATHNDIAQLASWMKDGFEESVFSKHVDWDTESAVKHFVDFIEDDNKVIFMSDNGAFCVYVNSPYFSKDDLLMESGFYVTPEKRGSLEAYRLFKKAKKWGKDRGVKGFWFGSSSGIEIGNSEKFYNGMGIPTIGNVFFNNFN